MANKWFKHYNDTHQNQGYLELWAENDTETIAFYFLVLELISLYEDENKRGFLEGNLSIFRAKVGMKSQRSRKLLGKIAQRFKVNLLWISDKSFQLSIPNWVNLQENRGGKTKSKLSQNTDRRKKREERGKKEEERREIKEINKEKIILEELKNSGGEKLLDKISVERQKVFLRAYSSDFVRGEALEACEWITRNPDKAPQEKNYGRFFSAWLKKGFKNSPEFKQNNAHKKGVLIGDPSGNLP